MKKQNSRGAILIFVLLMSSVIISTSTALLSTSLNNYKMKIINSRVKRAFYNAEGAMEEAYVITADFIDSAVEYAKAKDCFVAAYLDFLLGKCDNLTEQKSLAETLNDKSNYKVFNANNVSVNAELFPKTDSYQLEITSCCIDNKIEKSLKLICLIFVPDDSFSPDSTDPKDLICVVDWVEER